MAKGGVLAKEVGVKGPFQFVMHVGFVSVKRDRNGTNVCWLGKTGRLKNW